MNTTNEQRGSGSLLQNSMMLASQVNSSDGVKKQGYVPLKEKCDLERRKNWVRDATAKFPNKIAVCVEKAPNQPEEIPNLVNPK